MRQFLWLMTTLSLDREQIPLPKQAAMPALPLSEVNPMAFVESDNAVQINAWGKRHVRDLL
jgi:hypothetical protein